MTTTKVKTRKSDQLSRPGPEELFLYNSATNIWMEGKALYFPGKRNTANSRGSSEAFFRPKQKWSKVWISAASKPWPSIAGQTSYTSWNHSHGSGREQMLSGIGKITQEKDTFFVIFTLCSIIVFFPDKRIDRDQYIFFQWKLPCQCIYGFFEYMLWFNLVLV